MDASVQEPSGIKACFATACSDKPTCFALEFLVTPSKSCNLAQRTRRGLRNGTLSSFIFFQHPYSTLAGLSESLLSAEKLLVLSDASGIIEMHVSVLLKIYHV